MRGVDSVDEESRDVPPAILPDELHPWGQDRPHRCAQRVNIIAKETPQTPTAVEDETGLN